MPFGQLIIGPPGSGKSTYAYGLYQFLTALKRPVIIVNLDPAAPSPPYPASISITSLISLEDAMIAHNLGPNGAMLYCLEYLEKNLDWLEIELDKILFQYGWIGEKRNEAFVVFDTPGQVELSTDHGSLKNIVEQLSKRGGWRLSAVHLIDAHHITDAAKYVALLLLSLRTMLQLELPHINVLSKVDMLQNAGDLPFNLDYYTEVQDLDRLIPLLESDPRMKKFSSLNQIICDLIEDFNLVSFETLCVEDKESMSRLLKVVDQSLGYVPPSPHSHSNLSPEEAHQAHHASSSSHQPPSQTSDLSKLYYTTTVQEKWIDNIDTYATFEREGWKKEGELAVEVANRDSLRDAGGDIGRGEKMRRGEDEEGMDLDEDLDVGL